MIIKIYSKLFGYNQQVERSDIGSRIKRYSITVEVTWCLIDMAIGDTNNEGLRSRSVQIISPNCSGVMCNSIFGDDIVRKVLKQMFANTGTNK